MKTKLFILSAMLAAFTASATFAQTPGGATGGGQTPATPATPADQGKPQKPAKKSHKGKGRHAPAKKAAAEKKDEKKPEMPK